MDAEIRPIRIFGVVLAVLGVAGTFFFLYGTSPAPFFSPTSPSGIERVLFYSVMGVNIFYFLAGVGLLIRQKWGYFLFKLFLYMTFLGFPIGTLISYVTLSYMKRHQLKRHFGITT